VEGVTVFTSGSGNLGTYGGQQKKEKAAEENMAIRRKKKGL